MDIRLVQFNKLGGDLSAAVRRALDKANPNFLEQANPSQTEVFANKFATLPSEVKQFYSVFDGGKIKNIIFYSVTNTDKENMGLCYFFKDYATVENIRKFLTSCQVSVNEPLMFFANIGLYKRLAFNAAKPMDRVFEVDYNNPRVVTAYPSFTAWLNYNFN